MARKLVLEIDLDRLERKYGVEVDLWALAEALATTDDNPASLLCIVEEGEEPLSGCRGASDQVILELLEELGAVRR